MIDQQAVWQALEKCGDPELRLDIVYLGLVYEAKEQGEGTELIRMTLTSPSCPYGQFIVDSVKEEVGKVKGVKKVLVEVVFDPPWTPSDEVKSDLGLPL